MSSLLSPERITIGVLAIQGSFAEHIAILRALDTSVLPHTSVREVRCIRDLEECDGLIIPGGESTVITKWLIKNNTKVRKWYKGDGIGCLPIIWGTCAGLIILATHDHVGKALTYTLGGLDIGVKRNYYGGQVDSFERNVSLCSIDGTLNGEMHGIFIRAPSIIYTNNSTVKTLAHIVDNNKHTRVVAVENKHLMACTFHPELTNDTRLHEYFLRKVFEAKKVHTRLFK